jgi:hypothetical protein
MVVLNFMVFVETSFQQKPSNGRTGKSRKYAKQKFCARRDGEHGWGEPIQQLLSAKTADHHQSSTGRLKGLGWLRRLLAKSLMACSLKLWVKNGVPKLPEKFEKLKLHKIEL